MFRLRQLSHVVSAAKIRAMTTSREAGEKMPSFVFVIPRSTVLFVLFLVTEIWILVFPPCLHNPLVQSPSFIFRALLVSPSISVQVTAPPARASLRPPCRPGMRQPARRRPRPPPKWRRPRRSRRLAARPRKKSWGETRGSRHRWRRKRWEREPERRKKGHEEHWR